MNRLRVLQPEDLEIIPYTTTSGHKALRIVHKPTMLQVVDEGYSDYHTTRDTLLADLDYKVLERIKQQNYG